MFSLLERVLAQIRFAHPIVVKLNVIELHLISQLETHSFLDSGTEKENKYFHRIRNSEKLEKEKKRIGKEYVNFQGLICTTPCTA